MKIFMTSIATFAVCVTGIPQAAHAAEVIGRYDTTFGRAFSDTPPHNPIGLLCASPREARAAVIAPGGNGVSPTGAADLDLIEYDFAQPGFADAAITAVTLRENNGGAGTRYVSILKPYEGGVDAIGRVRSVSKSKTDDPEAEDFAQLREIARTDGPSVDCQIAPRMRAIAFTPDLIMTIGIGKDPATGSDRSELTIFGYSQDGGMERLKKLPIHAVSATNPEGGRITFLAFDEELGTTGFVVSRSKVDTVGWTFQSRNAQRNRPYLGRFLADQVSKRPIVEYKGVARVDQDLPDLMWRLSWCSTGGMTPPASYVAKDEKFAPMNISCDNLRGDLADAKVKYAEVASVADALSVWSWSDERGLPVSSLWDYGKDTNAMNRPPEGEAK